MNAEPNPTSTSASGNRTEGNAITRYLKKVKVGILELKEDPKQIIYVIGFLTIVAATAVSLLMFLGDDTVFAVWTIHALSIIAASGFWAIFLFLAVMLFQAIFMPIPSALVLFMTGIIGFILTRQFLPDFPEPRMMGIVIGAVLGIVGSIMTGMLCYKITLKGGRPVAEKMVPMKLLEPIDNLILRYGTWFIFAARAFPLMAFDPVSYGSGLLKVNWKKYLYATLMGSIIRSIFYAILGVWMLPAEATTPGVTWGFAEWQGFLEHADFEVFSSQFNIIFFSLVGVLLAFFLIYTFIINPIMTKRGKIVGIETGESMKRLAEIFQSGESTIPIESILALTLMKKKEFKAFLDELHVKHGLTYDHENIFIDTSKAAEIEAEMAQRLLEKTA